MPTIKQAAEELLKIADSIEKDAAEVTQFVCDKCNHTATLAGINTKRLEYAKQAAQAEQRDIDVVPITVNDKVACPACDGVMAYRATEESKPYYFDEKAAGDAPAADPNAPHDESKETPAQEKAESPETQKKEKEEGTEKHEQPKQAAVEAIDYDSLKRYA